MPSNQLNSPLHALTVAGAVRWVKCWKWTRTDGEVLRFCDGNREITLSGDVYSPVGGFSASAEESTDGVRAGNRDLKGVLRDERITFADLDAGKYRGCRIEEFIVDLMYPWKGNLRRNSYHIINTSFNGETYEVDLDGPLTKLGITRGYTHQRSCSVENFGDARCGFDLEAVRVSASVTVVDSRKQLQTTIPTGEGEEFYDEGQITWGVGSANEGLKSDVKAYSEANGVIVLQVETPYDIEVGDDFTIVPGCNREFSTCQRFQNEANFRGFPHIPGNDDTFETQDQKIED